MTLGSNIQKIRKEAHMSQEDFAENCGLSVELISLIERGQANPRMDTLAKIAAYLNVSISEMLQDS